jgi:hypothetical protein
VVELFAHAVVLPDLSQRLPQAPCRRQGHRARNAVRVKTTSTGWPFVPLALGTFPSPL